MSLTLGIIASSRGNIVPPLDTYGGAAAAYSTRLLNSAYGGSAVRVRRSFDNAEQDIGFSGGAIDETALMNFVGYQNLLLQSETFTNVAWDKSQSTVTPNAGTDPFGGNNATRWLSNVGATIHYIGQSLNLSAGTSYTISFYVKSNTGSSQQFRLFLNNGNTDTTISANLTATTDWQRFTYSLVGVAGTTVQGISRPNTNAAVDLLIYGAQINVGTTAQPYQVTTSAARSGDGFVTKWYTQDSNGENLLLQSQTFETANWNKFNSSIVADNTTAPDGTLTADKLNETAVTGQHGCVQNYTIPSANIYTFSIYVKAAERSTVNIVVYFNGGATDNFSARFNLSTGVVTSTSTGGAGVLISSTIQSVGSGWYRCSIIGNTTMSGSHSIQLGLLDAALNTTYLGVAGSGVFIWGAQLSQSTWLQPYQVTTTTAILRRDAFQSTAANQPRIVGGGVIERENGKASIRFDGTDDFLSLASDITYTTTGNQYISAVFTPAVAITVANIYVPLATIGTADSRMIYALGSVTSSLVNERLSYLTVIGGNVLGYGQTVSDLSPTPKLQSISFDPPSLFNIFQNSIQQQFSTSTSGAFSSSQYPSTFGRIGASPSPSSFFLGDMQEIILYGTSRSANRGDIDRNVGAYYQTQWTGASSGLLDQFGGAAAAYSLRNLSSSYRGPLIRVRRSSDNAETDIGGTYNGDLDVASLLSFTGGQNLATNSEDFTAWIVSNIAAVSNVTIAPNGTLTADKVNETAVNGQHFIRVTPNLSTSIYTSSFYLKAAERYNVIISLQSVTSPIFAGFSMVVNLLNGSVRSTFQNGISVIISYNVENVGNGWYRCSVTGNTSLTSQHAFSLFLLNDAVNESYLGVAGSGVYIWGAQLNTGILQPYIPTTTAAVNGANAFVTKWYTQDNNYQNLVTFSEQFENGIWGKSNLATTVNAGLAPDGTNTADFFQELTYTAANANIVQTITQTILGTYTQSVYIKPVNNARYFGFDLGNATARVRTTFDVVDKTFLAPNYTASASAASFSYLEIGGYFRISITVTFGASVTNPSFGIGIIATNTYMYFLSQNSDNRSFFLWGAQLNEGTLVPYTATTTTASQRRDAIQATAASQPRIVNAGGVESEGNKPAITFISASQNGLSVPSSQGTFKFLHDGTQNTHAVVFSNKKTGFSYLLSTNGGVSAAGYSLIASSTSVNYIDSFIYGSSTVVDNISSNNTLSAQDLVVVVSDPTNATASNRSFIYVDGRSAISNNTQTGAVSSANATYDLAIGWRGTTTYEFNGTMNEVVLYPTNQTSVRQTIESNINSYYQIYWQGNGTALLDNYSGASAAYSLRNLSSAYTGPLIRVRRSNDNVERDIYGTFGGDLDIASLVAFVGANSGFVTTWYDQSGSARHATQATAASQPRIVNAGVVETKNGKPSVLFTAATGTVLAATSAFTGTAGTLINISATVTDPPTAGYGSPFGRVGDTGSSSSHQPYLDGVIYETFATNTRKTIGNPTNNTTNIYLYDVVSDSGLYRARINNSVFFTTTTNTVVYNTATPLIGSSGTYAFEGYVSEIVIYTSNQSATLPAISSNINNYYKIY